MQTVYETQIRTGHPGGDQQMLEQVRRTYEPQGLSVHVQPLPGGGFHVRVVQMMNMQQAYAQQQPQQAYYSQPPQQSYGHPQGGYGGPAPQHNPYGGPTPQHNPYGGPSPMMAGAGAMAAMPVGFAGSVAESIGAQRVRYLRKVYGLLAISAFLAIAAGWLCISPLLGEETYQLESGKRIAVPLVVAIMLENPAIEYGTFAVLFVSVLIASMVSKVRGLNYVALFGVSILMGVELSPMVFVAQVRAGLGMTMTAAPVEAAFAMVGAIFIGITSYVFIARKDFSYLGATLSMGFWVVLAGCVVAFAIDSEPLTLAVASVGALLSIGFLLYQTSWIFRNSDMDDPVEDALGLIVQLRNLFMFLLSIFMRR